MARSIAKSKDGICVYFSLRFRQYSNHGQGIPSDCSSTRLSNLTDGLSKNPHFWLSSPHRLKGCTKEDQVDFPVQKSSSGETQQTPTSPSITFPMFLVTPCSLFPPALSDLDRIARAKAVSNLYKLCFLLPNQNVCDANFMDSKQKLTLPHPRTHIHQPCIVSYHPCPRSCTFLRDGKCHAATTKRVKLLKLSPPAPAFERPDISYTSLRSTQALQTLNIELSTQK